MTEEKSNPEPDMFDIFSTYHVSWTEQEQEQNNIDVYSKWDPSDSGWNEAVSPNTHADPFCCQTEWQLSYHEAMEPDRRLVIRESSGSIVALAVEITSPDEKVLFPIESGWQFGCPLLGPFPLELLDDIIIDEEYDLNGIRTAPSIVISGVLPNGVLKRRLIDRYKDRFDFQKLSSEELCSASLLGGIDGYLSRRSSSHRRGLRKQSKRAHNAGVTFEHIVPTTHIEAEATYQRMLAVEESGWKGVGKCGMTMQPSRDYYSFMLRRLADSGAGRVVFARHDDIDIGYLFGGMAGDIYRGQQFSFAVDWKSQSIGNLLQLEQVRSLCDEGATRYDMGPIMEYKRHWTETKTTIESLVMRPI